MSKYNLTDIFEGMSNDEMSKAQEADRLEKHPERDKIKKIQALMAKEKAGIEVDESFDSLAKKLDKQKGIDKEEAAKIAGSIAAKKAAGAGKGPTAKQKKRMNEVRIEREVANRIEGMLNIQLKSKFLNYFEELLYDLLEDEPFYVDDVIAHLSNEMHKRVNGNQMAGDRLAGMDQQEFTAINEEKPYKPVEPEYTLDSIAQDEFLKNYDELDPQQQRYVRSELEITKGYPFSAGVDQDGYRLPEFPDPMKNMKEESTKVDFIRALKVDANGTSLEIKSYLESLKRSGDKFDSVDDYVEDFKNYVADKSLQEHFGRFLKDYQ